MAEERSPEEPTVETEEDNTSEGGYLADSDADAQPTGEGEGEGETREENAENDFPDPTEPPALITDPAKSEGEEGRPSQSEVMPEDRKVSGDFGVVQRTYSEEEALRKRALRDRDVVKSSSSSSYSSSSGATLVNGQEEIETEEDPPPPLPIDREAYAAEYRELMAEKSFITLKNNILQRKLADYFRKRKLDHVLKEVDNTGGFDLEAKYREKLLVYQKMKAQEEFEKNQILQKVNEIEAIRDGRQMESERLFTEMQERERTIGTGLVFSKTGKELPEKVLERYLVRQSRVTDQISALRLRYLRAKAAVAHEEATLHSLEYLGEGLHVCDYEQLRIDNQNYAEKIEERDEELTKNRFKCTSHNQTLGHIREKMHFLDEACESAECDLGDCELETRQARESLSVEQLRRDTARATLIQLKQKSGLLSRKDLLYDFDSAINECSRLKDIRSQLESQLNIGDDRLRTLRSALAASAKLIEEARPPLDIRPRLWKHRPTMIRSRPRRVTRSDFDAYINKQ